MARVEFPLDTRGLGIGFSGAGIALEPAAPGDGNAGQGLLRWPGTPAVTPLRSPRPWDGIDPAFEGNPRTPAYHPAATFYAGLPRFRARSGGMRPIHLSHFGDLELYRIRALILYRRTTLYQENDGMLRPLNGGWVMTGGFRLRFRIPGGERRLTGPSEMDVAANY